VVLPLSFVPEEVFAVLSLSELDDLSLEVSLPPPPQPVSHNTSTVLSRHCQKTEK
jgi:hypothetical protein